jgi:GMP synthase PP-ATPase subunit
LACISQRRRIYIDELRRHELYDKVSKAFAVFLAAA